MRFRFSLLNVLLLSGCLAACGVSPPAQYFVLESLPDSNVQKISAQKGDRQSPSIGLSKVSMPAYLDRLPIVRRQGAALSFDGYQRWAEPLAEAVPRVLTENLSVLLPDDRIVQQPWTAQSRPDWRLTVSIDRLEAMNDKSVELHARWVLLDQEGKTVSSKEAGFSESINISSVSTDDMVAIVAAHSKTLAALSRAISQDISALPTH
jgi:uncharacterized protein